MNNKCQTYYPSWQEIAMQPFVQGPLLGASVMAMVTPLIKWTNHSLNGQKMCFKQPMSGATAYALSAIPSYTASFGFKAILANHTSESYDLFTSFTAGVLSGICSTPFEAIGLNKHLLGKVTTKEVIQKIYNQGGGLAFFRGGGSVGLREGGWATVYMSAIRNVSENLQKANVPKSYADFVAVVVVAGSYGVISTPLSMLRNKKQVGLASGAKNKSYLQHVQDILSQNSQLSSRQKVGLFFKAGVPRSITTMVGAGLFVEGQKVYNNICK